jgi:serine phosphatase RsbU (regulator of sigma subunit)
VDAEDALNRVSRLEEENRRLRRALEELAVLNEIASAICSTMSLDRMVESMVEKCVHHLKVEQGAVMLLREEEADAPFQTMVRKTDSAANVVPYHFGGQLTGWMLKNRRPLLINDLKSDPRFQAVGPADFPIRSLLSVPLVLKGRLIGLLNVFNRQGREGFTEEDQRLLGIIAAQSAQAIENARLYEEEQTLLRVQEELRLAYEIQTNLLPKASPEVAGYDIAGKSIPAQDVGGDYYDFIPMDDRRLAICLGDVSGKGMPAALLMANVQATVRGQTLLSLSPGECVRRSNTLLFRSTDIQRFVTFFYGILDTGENRFSYSNAGHNHPLLFSADREPLRLGTGGLVLGIMEDVPFGEKEVSFNPGDLLVIYSDGITEAMDAQEEDFGEERLIAVAREHREDSCRELIEKVLQAVRRHAGNVPQMDDMTLVAIRRGSG